MYFYEKFSKALETLPAIAYVIDVDAYEIVAMNSFAKNELGISGGICYKAIYGLDSPCHFCSVVNRSSPDNALYVDKEVKNERNKKFYRIHESITDDDNGKKLKFTIAFDITKEKIASSESQKLYTLLKNIAENAPDMIWAKDTEGKYIFANKVICNKLLGATPEEVLGKNDIFFAQRERSLHPDDDKWHTFGEMCLNSDIPVLQEKIPMKFEEYGNVKGRFLHLEVHKAPLFDSEGTLIGTVGMGRDITRQKELEADLITINKTLEQLVEEKSKKIVERDRLIAKQNRVTEMGDMLGALAHQWRQPLNALGLMIQDTMMAFEFGEMNGEYIKRFKREGMEQINFMSKTIDDFRKFFSIDKRKQEFNVAESINEIVMLMRPQLSNNGISVEYNPDKVFVINGYRNEFKQLILGLIRNSKDAIETKKIKNPKIIIDILEDEEYIKLNFSDNGGGIDMDIIDKIFDPYFTTKAPNKGTGMGLYMAKTILEEHMQGFIYVRNNNIGGSTFEIDILKTA